jgi:hypothetical protein
MLTPYTPAPDPYLHLRDPWAVPEMGMWRSEHHNLIPIRTSHAVVDCMTSDWNEERQNVPLRVNAQLPKRGTLDKSDRGIGLMRLGGMRDDRETLLWVVRQTCVVGKSDWTRQYFRSYCVFLEHIGRVCDDF